jgi:hypothetical protein
LDLGGRVRRSFGRRWDELSVASGGYEKQTDRSRINDPKENVKNCKSVRCDDEIRGRLLEPNHSKGKVKNGRDKVICLHPDQSDHSGAQRRRGSVKASDTRKLEACKSPGMRRLDESPRLTEIWMQEAVVIDVETNDPVEVRFL